jgi:site-specific recombinase XerD/ribosomal protein L40E
MERRIDIHNLERRLQLAEMRLHNPLSGENVRIIKDFECALFSEGLSTVRVEKYVETVRKIGEMLGGEFDKATKKDIEELVYKIERSEYSPWTKHDFKVALKRFYRWLKGGEEYPEEVKWIKTTLKAKDELLPDELLTEDEIMKLVNSCDSIRDKAFIITLYESGARIGELGSMRIKDVVFEEKYVRLMLKGKTGSRSVIAIAALPYLQNWIQNHPLKDDPDAPLWVNVGNVNKHKPMSYPALAKILKAAAKRSGLKKKIHPHKLRHSRATFLASKLTEAQMNQIFGWRQGSDMPSIYVHLSGRDVEDAILGVYGLKKVEEKESKIKPRVCPRCNMLNEFDAKFCKKCGLALDVTAAEEMEKTRQKIGYKMKLFMEDKEFVELLERKLKEMKFS